MDIKSLHDSKYFKKAFRKNDDVVVYIPKGRYVIIYLDAEANNEIVCQVYENLKTKDISLLVSSGKIIEEKDPFLSAYELVGKI